MRRCVVADPGYKLFSIDYSQAESFVTGGLAFRDGGDRAYLMPVDLETYIQRLRKRFGLREDGQGTLKRIELWQSPVLLRPFLSRYH